MSNHSSYPVMPPYGGLPGASRRGRRACRRRRGTVLVLAAFLFSLLISMLVFAIDVGFIAVSRTEAHRTSDAAALGGGWEMLDGLKRKSPSAEIQRSVILTAQEYAGCNSVCNERPVLGMVSGDTDIQLGYLSSLSRTSPLVDDASLPFAAVRVRVQKTKEFNGQVPLFFARFFGMSGTELKVESTSALALQIRGFRDPGPGMNHNILPLALDLETWNAMKAGAGNDDFQWSRGTVTSGSDGMREMNLYPQGTGSSGNRGSIDIGPISNSTSELARQIVHGITAEDLEGLGKPLWLDDSGTVELTGDPGISAGIKDELESIVGQERVVPIFSNARLDGNNAHYTVCQWVGVRVLHVDLKGAMRDKKVLVQPTGMVARNIIPGDSSRVWSEGIFSPVVLVQ